MGLLWRYDIGYTRDKIELSEEIKSTETESHKLLVVSVSYQVNEQIGLLKTG